MPRRSARLANDTTEPEALGSVYIRPASLPSRATEADDTTSSEDIEPFRLLDLPAEVRNRVYGQVFANRPQRDMSYFSIPPIALTCRQLRDEALPIFFAETNFHVNVGGNFVAVSRARITGWTEDDQRHLSMAGTLSTKRFISNFLKNAGEAAFFRNVSFDIFDTSEIELERMASMSSGGQKWFDNLGLNPFAVLSLDLRVVEGKLSVSAEEGGFHPRLFPYGFSIAGDVRDIDKAVEKATAIAREIAAKEGFKGLKMSDLRKVAKAFRVERDMEVDE